MNLSISQKDRFRLLSHALCWIANVIRFGQSKNFPWYGFLLILRTFKAEPFNNEVSTKEIFQNTL